MGNLFLFGALITVSEDVEATRCRVNSGVSSSYVIDRQ